MVKLKICGIFREDDIAFANEALPHYIGFVFAPKSRRYVKARQAAALRKKLDPAVIPVGVFVNAGIDDIAALCRDGVIDMVQLHGGETDEYLARLREKCGAPLIKAFDAEELRARGGNVRCTAEYLLVDNGGGGTGECFDWSLLDSLRVHARENPALFLAGGIGPGNIDEALARRPYAVDVSSGAETNGIKDRKKMVQLMEKVRGFAERTAE
ncbi:MAG: phosphoribosylanthranilate isomerase [Treponema sp.]|jgi:phosphoribosylanthranilate isomerase|nr:phosphoribosylanthranilate isomerase [Treponema sp.]